MEEKLKYIENEISALGMQITSHQADKLLVYYGLLV